MIDFAALDARLVEATGHYEKTAPVVSNYCNELYARLRDEPEKIVLTEILFVGRLVEEGEWMHPNYAANQLLHVLDRIGRDTSGMVIDF